MSTLLTQAGLTLLTEAGLACLLAVLLGYLFWKSHSAALTLGLITLSCNIVLLLLLALAFDPAQMPFLHLDLRMTKFSDGVASYLAITYIILEIAVWTTALAAALGYFFNEGGTAIVFAAMFTFATVFCLIVSALPFYLFDTKNTIWALLVAIVVVGTGGIWFLAHILLKDKGVAFLTLLWFGFCFTCWISYQVAGRVGLLLIALPTQAILWGLLYYFSILSLPVPEHARIPTLLNLLPFIDKDNVEPPNWRSLFPAPNKDLDENEAAEESAAPQKAAKATPVEKRDPRVLALRSVLTLAMGTNYPFYVIEDWKTRATLDQNLPEPRAAGNPYGQFFAGPGIILTNCDHLAVTTTGLVFRVCLPGLSFTGQYEQLYTDVDLRPQLRVMTINAETQDGIGVKIFTFMPNRVWADGRKVALDGSYPFDEEAVIKAVYDHAVVDRTFERDENQLATEEAIRRPWHELVLTMGPPILKDVVANYTCNELHMAVADPDRSSYGTAQKTQPFDDGDSALPQNGGLPLTVKLQQFMARRLDADALKELAFDLGVNFTLFACETETELAHALVEDAKQKDTLACLARQVHKCWPSQYIARTFPDPGNCTLPLKVEVLVEDTRVPLDALMKALAAQFEVPEAQIIIVGATTEAEDQTLRFLIGVPEDTVTLRILSELRAPDGKKCRLTQLTAFDALSTKAQNAWRYASCSTPPTLDGDFIQPGIVWDDAVAASRVRSPRVEIANAFIGKLKEEMRPLGIEVVGGGISDIKVPKEITAQRIKNWSATRDRDVEIAIAEAQARIALREQEIQAEVRLEILTHLAQILQEADTGVNKQLLAIKLFEAMGIHPAPEDGEPGDDGLQSGGNPQYLPPYMLNILRKFSG